MFETDLATKAVASENQDQAAIIEHPKGLLLVIADGAGGLGGGREAAELLIKIVKETAVPATEFLNPLMWCTILTQADEQLSAHPIAGETTAVVVALSDNLVCGASVGNSGAFLVQDQTTIELTTKQRHRPLLGSESAIPTSFGSIPLNGRLLLATDGLIKHAPLAKIREIMQNNPTNTANALVECVRYPSGNLPDDVTVIVTDAIPS